LKFPVGLRLNIWLWVRPRNKKSLFFCKFLAFPPPTYRVISSFLRDRFIR